MSLGITFGFQGICLTALLLIFPYVTKDYAFLLIFPYVTKVYAILLTFPNVSNDYAILLIFPSISTHTFAELTLL